MGKTSIRNEIIKGCCRTLYGPGPFRMRLKVAQMTLEGVRKKIMKVEEHELGFKRWMPFFT